MAKPSPAPTPTLLVTELWAMGDLAVALPFLQTASRHATVTLLAKPHAAALLRRFAPDIELIVLDAPWTAFRGKYRFHRWPWRILGATLRTLRSRHFDLALSARPDPREHAFLRLVGAARLIGYPRAGSDLLLSQSLPKPANPHRVAYWRDLAAHLGWTLPAPVVKIPQGRHIVIHTHAAQPVRRWPRDRFETIAAKLRAVGWTVTLIDEPRESLETFIATLATADRFIGNDSGPGHLAALLGVPTFTIFGPQLPENFAPVHPQAAWIEGSPCPYKPCLDYCRFAQPNCILDITADAAWAKIEPWLSTYQASSFPQ